MHAEYEKQWRHVAMLSNLMGQVPKINDEIEGVMRTLGELENLFMEVEVSLLALEDTMDAREAQEKQLEQRFQLAIYQERRRQELEELESRLEIQLTSKISKLVFLYVSYIITCGSSSLSLCLEVTLDSHL